MLHSKPTPSDCNFITSYKSAIANDKSYYYSASESAQVDNKAFYDWKLQYGNFANNDIKVNY